MSEMTNKNKPIRPVLTRALAYAAAQDAGSRSMHKGKRPIWSEDDYQAACNEFTRLWGTADQDAWAKDHA